MTSRSICLGVSPTGGFQVVELNLDLSAALIFDFDLDAVGHTALGLPLADTCHIRFLRRFLLRYSNPLAKGSRKKLEKSSDSAFRTAEIFE